MMEKVGHAAASFTSVLAEAPFPAGRKGDRLVCKTKTFKHGKDQIDLTVWNIGGLLLAALPVELFSSLGADLRRRAGKPLLLSTCANGWNGYWPDRRAFSEGGYEVGGAIQAGRKPGDGERLVRQMLGMVRSV
jgi:hypothetical protein